MKSKHLWLWISILSWIILASRFSLVNANSIQKDVQPSRVLYYSENANMNIVSNVTNFVVIHATLQISIESNINQSIWIDFSHDLSGNISLYESDLINLTSGINYFEFEIQLTFFNIIGIFNLDLFISRADNDGGKQLIYYNAYPIQIVLNPFLAINLIFIFLFFFGYLLLKKEPLMIFPHSSPASVSSSNNKKYKLIEGRRPIPCPSCRQKIPEGSAYCSYCGYHLALFERRLL